MATLKGQEVTSLTLGFEGFARWLRLGDAALRDLLERSGLERPAFTRTGIHLQLSGTWLEEVHLQGSLLDRLPPGERDRIRWGFDAERTEKREQLTRRFLPELLALNQLPLAPRSQLYAFGGAATFTQVLAWAVEALRSRVLERCIVGGIDSWVDGETLTQAYEMGLLRTPNRPVGRFPGEAAAFVLLERLDAAHARGARVEALLGPVASTVEAGHRFSGRPLTGAALFEAIRACFPEGARQAEGVGLSIVNLNGDEPRSREYGYTLVRLQEAGLPTSSLRWYVPEHFGEIGAATGAVAICMGVRGFMRGYARSPSILVSLLDDELPRGAFLLRDVPWRQDEVGVMAPDGRQS
jgi:3-oxoacyl-[acyl-carrier-protein] synthase-1